MITIQELLRTRGLGPSARVKLVRHTDSSSATPAKDYLADRHRFLAYQSRQSKDVFRDVDCLNCI